ncbi:MAG: TrkH family potassium uptake protein [Proteobacteria bacterium]|nr:TrkH family potassium uptake protein [Pseudomonadota bacterium]
MNIYSKIFKIHPATLVLTGFLVAIFIGTIALKLPISTKSGAISYVDALFTATSAVCVTGLVVVDTGEYFTVFGQCIILVLIQIGGLGVMTISVILFQWLGRNISIRQRMAMQDLFTHTPREDIVNLVRSIILFTFGAELIGAVLLTVFGYGDAPLLSTVYTAIFHSISAFCNAGFALFPDSMVRYSGNLPINTTLCALIVVGGIGFPVLYDIRLWLGGRKNTRVRLSIQTKTVLLTSLALIASGALFFAFLERQSFNETQSLTHRILIPVFQSITCRTAGFNTVDIASLKEATLTMMIFLMFFGASPGSCGGGVKTTTLALITVFTYSRIRRRRRVNFFKKSIPSETVTRSVSLILVSISVIFIALFLILAGESSSSFKMADHQGAFLSCLFETVSAFGTVGLSMGITPEFGIWGKCLIILMMIIGRVGLLTFSYIIVGTGATNGLEYSEENLMIG